MNGNVLSRYSGMIFPLFIWAAFFFSGMFVWNQVCSSHAEGVFGYDYMLYVRQLSDVNWISYTGVRHPGLGLVMSPVVFCGKALSVLGETLRDVFFVAFFAGVATANLLLIRHVAGWIASTLFLSFGWTWVLASVPESFPVAMMMLLLVLVLLDSRIEGRERWIAWALLFLFSSVVTVTNGLKVMIVFLLAENCPRKIKGLVCLGVVVLAAIGVLYFYVRLELWNVAHPEMTKSVAGALAQTFSWVPDGMSMWGRLRAMVVNFFLIPVLPIFSLPVESGFVLHNSPAIGWLGWAWGVCVYLVAIVALWRVRNCRLAKAMCGMFAVDVVIHLVCGWGLQEGWLFSAHWFFMIPIAIGLAFSRRRGVASSL